MGTTGTLKESNAEYEIGNQTQLVHIQEVNRDTQQQFTMYNKVKK